MTSLGFFNKYFPGRNNFGCKISISAWRLASGFCLMHMCTSHSYIFHKTESESVNRSVGHKISNVHLNLNAEQTKNVFYF